MSRGRSSPEPRRLRRGAVHPAVLVYDDTTLARDEVAAGWRDVLALGASADLIDEVSPTGGADDIASASFAHYTGGGDVQVEA